MKIAAEYKHFIIRELPAEAGREARDYAIHNKRNGLRMGTIRWYGAWRQYCFWPQKFAETVWSDGCLADVRDFLGKLREQRKAEVKE